MTFFLALLRWTLLSFTAWSGYALLPLPGADALTPATVLLLSVLTPLSYVSVGWPVIQQLARMWTWMEHAEP